MKICIRKKQQANKRKLKYSNHVEEKLKIDKQKRFAS